MTGFPYYGWKNNRKPSAEVREALKKFNPGDKVIVAGKHSAVIVEKGDRYLLVRFDDSITATKVAVTVVKLSE